MNTIATSLPLRRLAARIAAFGLVSGIGWTMDFVIFGVLLALGTDPLVANLVSASCAVTFVYVASVRRVFEYRGGFLLGKFCAYVCYQIAAVTAASALIGWLADLGPGGIGAKVLVTPATFAANYAFMHLLVGREEDRDDG